MNSSASRSSLPSRIGGRRLTGSALAHLEASAVQSTTGPTPIGGPSLPIDRRSLPIGRSPPPINRRLGWDRPAFGPHPERFGLGRRRSNRPPLGVQPARRGLQAASPQSQPAAGEPQSISIQNLQRDLLVPLLGQPLRGILAVDPGEAWSLKPISGGWPSF